MDRRRIISAAVVICVFLSGCDKSKDKPTDTKQSGGAASESSDTVPNVVTADIQAGIEKYIEEQVRSGDGYFNISFKDKPLRLKLVRVHTEYLSNLGPRSHFACVDLVDISGDVYDVDFFLAGDPGAMTVTETTVHKINGQPFYAWEQKPDGSWHRVPLKKASQGLLGVVKGHDEFEFCYRTALPQITDNAKMWLPLPATDSFQTVEVKSIKAPGQHKILYDHKYRKQGPFSRTCPRRQ